MKRFLYILGTATLASVTALALEKGLSNYLLRFALSKQRAYEVTVKDNVIHVDFVAKKRMPPPDGTELPKKAPPAEHEKKVAFLELMNTGMVRTAINGLHDQVIMPPQLKQPVINLNWSYKFGIPDLQIDDAGIKGTLLFNQEPIHVTVPWEAVVSIWNVNSPKDSRIDW